ncbi:MULTISPECIES: metal-dependent hydrolase [unclassified Haladaptatus]|uniref:metal-dependent hydrolase n=1 Tax=unclassified Haladaptatus TaxID=2622732 RepID=UPI0023E8DDA0|nr:MULTISPECIES: metal-dependent hydrolase [unclassified Haladaptatus]
MYATGHYGAALLVYAPVGVALTLSGQFELAVVGGGLMLAFSTLPDIDIKTPLIPHRGPTHTILFALLVGAGLGWVALRLTTPILAGFAFGVGVLSIASHLLADWITPMGIKPFWPFSRRRYSLDLTTAKNPVANYLLLGLGVFVTAVSVLYLQ